ncbi:hypothetical protein ABFX02_10G035300 [Erythranthe guttata]
MANLDMTLDDMIKKNKSSRAGPRTSGPGPTRRLPNRSASAATPYSSSTSRAPVAQWNHDTFTAEPAFPVVGGARVSAIETGTKLLVSNLHFGVSDEDIKEIFSGVGDLKSCSVHYDRVGRSEGTAEVVFFRRRDAEAAIKRYNNVQLDGKPMRIEIIGLNMAMPPLLPLPLPTPSHGRNVPFQASGSAVRRPQGAARGMRKVNGVGRGRAEKISAEDLDADLDKYLAKAKETN